MARIDPNILIDTAIRIDYVRRDPAVIVAARAAAADVCQAGRSVGRLAVEIRASWARYPGGNRFAPSM